VTKTILHSTVFLDTVCITYIAGLLCCTVSMSRCKPTIDEAEVLTEIT